MASDRASVLARFMSRVVMGYGGTGPKGTECWVWGGSATNKGYGSFSLSHECTRPAHRVAYLLLVGPVPDGLVLDHLCRNRLCVNPDHLEPVTDAENILRGCGFAAQNARKTKCPRGHALEGENLMLCTRPRGVCRVCRACRLVADRGRRVLLGATPRRFASKTACPYGHAFTPENTLVERHGQRRCRTCYRKRQRDRYAARTPAGAKEGPDA